MRFKIESVVIQNTPLNNREARLHTFVCSVRQRQRRDDKEYRYGDDGDHQDPVEFLEDGELVALFACLKMQDRACQSLQNQYCVQFSTSVKYSCDLPFREMIVHIRKQVSDKARGKIKKRIKKSEAVSSSTLTEPIAYRTAKKE